MKPKPSKPLPTGRLYDFCCGLIAGSALGLLLGIVRVLYLTRISPL